MVNLCGVAFKITQVFVPKSKKKDITFFEVKDLYNRAYEERARARNALRQYKKIERRAKMLDEAYRTQCGLNRRAA